MKIKFFLLLFILISTYSIGKYYERIEMISENKIFKPIVEIENDERIELNEILENIVEYNFLIRNYNGERVNNLELLYKIIIENNINNENVQYYLKDETKNENVEIRNNETEYMKLGKEKLEKKYKLFINFNDEKLINGNLKIRIEVIQEFK